MGTESWTREVESRSDGRLRARSSREAEVQALLDRARPGWRWEPMSLEVDGEQARVYTGLPMRLRLVGILGPVRALRVAQIVARFGGPVLGVDVGRRDFLRRALGALAGWIALRSVGQPAAAAAAPPSPAAPGLPPIRQSRLLEGEAREALLRKFQGHPDLRALGMKAPGPESEAVAVLHELADGNRLEAVAWVEGERQIIVAYLFDHPQVLETSPVRMQSEALRIAAEGERARLVMRSVNGRLTAGTRAGDGILIQPMSHCPGCSGNCWMGPYETDCLSCASWNISCLVGCCATCAFMCIDCALGNLRSCAYCFACVFVICPWCGNGCCTRWVHSCCPCSPCPGP
ncbi:hypothetical protein [Thermoflexus sp.]|uniref:hypothetical protein n=1 Tax=Thermoflexus sp. TaxID=1969742 RepID=UPI0026245B85|nr:hypothetical protein [Thermoflexus sp.]MCX7690977.1 hypothetical protein [Thermoflexus sp.]